MKPLLKIKQAAELLGISERKLWELGNCGEIPVVRFGRCIRFDPADIEEWVEKMKGGRRR